MIGRTMTEPGTEEYPSHIGHIESEERTEFYVPWLQFLLRILLGILTALYFFWHKVPRLAVSDPPFVLVLVAYFVFHLCWWQRCKRRGMGIHGVRVACWIDLIGAGMAMLNDGSVVPPSLILLFIAALGNGVQHGERVFSELLIGALIVCGIVVPMRQSLLGAWPSYNLVFLMLFLVICLYYAYFVVTRIEQLKKEAIKSSECDILTGMLNRRAFTRASRYLLSAHDRTGLPLVVMFADVDGFKQVNDKLGHETGDRVRQRFAAGATARSRGMDITARYGGDEFVFMLLNAEADDARRVGLRIQEEFSAWTRQLGVEVGISFGIAELPSYPTDLAHALRVADKALYEAKKAGPGGMAVAPPM